MTIFGKIFSGKASENSLLKRIFGHEKSKQMKQHLYADESVLRHVSPSIIGHCSTQERNAGPHFLHDDAEDISRCRHDLMPSEDECIINICELLEDSRSTTDEEASMSTAPANMGITSCCSKA